MYKTVKSKLSEFFKLDPVDEKAQQYVSLVDMVMTWYLAILTPEDYEAKKRGLVLTTIGVTF